jgi:hypothetical protein
LSPDDPDFKLEPWEPCNCRHRRENRLETWTGRAVLNGCLLVLISALGGITIGELVWLFLRYLDGP